LVFKREQVDLLAGDDVIPLADSGELEPIGLQSSGSSVGLAESKESTGINIFEADGTDDADPSAVTRVTSAPGSLVDPGDKSASGSGGLLDMTREPDDTSLGADLLGDVYGNETMAAQTTTEPAIAGDAGALFETPGAVMETTETTTTAIAMVPAEVYDGTASGWVGGLALGAIIAVALAAFTLIIGLTSTAGGGMLKTIGDNFMILVGVAAALPVLFAVIGLVLGKRS
jgi:hypothetical protein